MKSLVPLLKENGAKQRVDVTLTPAIANALKELVLTGAPLYPDEGFVVVSLKGEGEKENLEIARGTINSWVTRGIVIEGTGQRLRDVLDDARIERKRVDREIRQADIIEKSELALNELISIPIVAGKTIETSFKKNKKGFAAYRRVETETEGVNPKLAEAKIKGITFALERLDSPRYGSKSSVANTHLVFSLGDLRRAKERRDELAAQPV